MYTNARFQSIETTLDIWSKFAQNYLNEIKRKKIKIKIVINI